MYLPSRIRRELEDVYRSRRTAEICLYEKRVDYFLKGRTLVDQQPFQDDVVAACMDGSRRVVSLSAPCQSGKSLTATCVATLLFSRSLPAHLDDTERSQCPRFMMLGLNTVDRNSLTSMKAKLAEQLSLLHGSAFSVAVLEESQACDVAALVGAAMDSTKPTILLFQPRLKVLQHMEACLGEDGLRRAFGCCVLWLDEVRSLLEFDEAGQKRSSSLLLKYLLRPRGYGGAGAAVEEEQPPRLELGVPLVVTTDALDMDAFLLIEHLRTSTGEEVSFGRFAASEDKLRRAGYRGVEDMVLFGGHGIREQDRPAMTLSSSLCGRASGGPLVAAAAKKGGDASALSRDGHCGVFRAFDDHFQDFREAAGGTFSGAESEAGWHMCLEAVRSKGEMRLLAEHMHLDWRGRRHVMYMHGGGDGEGGCYLVVDDEAAGGRWSGRRERLAAVGGALRERNTGRLGTPGTDGLCLLRFPTFPVAVRFLRSERALFSGDVVWGGCNKVWLITNLAAGSITLSGAARVTHILITDDLGCSLPTVNQIIGRGCGYPDASSPPVQLLVLPELFHCSKKLTELSLQVWQKESFQDLGVHCQHVATICSRYHKQVSHRNNHALSEGLKKCVGGGGGTKRQRLRSAAGGGGGPGKRRRTSSPSSTGTADSRSTEDAEPPSSVTDVAGGPVEGVLSLLLRACEGCGGVDLATWRGCRAYDAGEEARLRADLSVREEVVGGAARLVRGEAAAAGGGLSPPPSLRAHELARLTVEMYVDPSVVAEAAGSARQARELRDKVEELALGKFERARVLRAESQNKGNGRHFMSVESCMVLRRSK
jgi:hypothetical protein